MEMNHTVCRNRRIDYSRYYMDTPLWGDNGSKIKFVQENTMIYPNVKKVYFNDPVTVVIWDDGSKTIVRCGEHDIYSPQTGLLMCIAKKAMGSGFNDVLREWIDGYDEDKTADQEVKLTEQKICTTSITDNLKELNKKIDEGKNGTKYRSKLKIVDAFQYGVDDVPDWFHKALTDEIAYFTKKNNVLKILTWDGSRTCCKRDYVTKDEDDYIYPLGKEYFEDHFEKVE